MPLRINAATGEAVFQQEDLRLPGYIPLVLARTYRSRTDASGRFGHGWRLNLDVALRVGDTVTYAPAAAQEVAFGEVAQGMQARHDSGVLLQHHPDAYMVVPSPSRRLVFSKEAARGPEIPLGRIEDASGNSVHFFHDRGQLTGIVDTLGRQIRFDVQSERVRRLRLVGDDGAGATVRTFRYSSAGDLVEARDADGAAAAFRYQDHLMTEYTCRDGGTQYAQYDDQRRCHALWRADGSDVRRFAYDEARQQARVVQGEGRQTVYQFDQPGHVLERVSATDQSQNYYYDERHQLIGFSDVQETVQTFQQLDLDEAVATLTDAEQRIAIFDVDDHLRVTAIQDGLENAQTLAYSPEHRLVQLRTAAGTEWRFERDGRGAVAEIAGPTEHSVRLTRHPDRSRLVIEEGHGRRAEEHVDGWGRLVERTDALGRRLQWRYDANGRLRSVRADGQSIEFAYSPGGEPTRVAQNAGSNATMHRDAFGRVRQLDIDGRTYHVNYNASGWVETVTGPEGRAMELAHTEDGHVSQIRHFGGGTTTYRRTEEGTEVATDGAAGRTTAQYNAAGDPVRWQKPGAAPTLLSYGPSGELISVEQGNGFLYLDYDANGRIVEATADNQSVQLTHAAEGGIEALRADGARVLRGRCNAYGEPVELETSQRTYRLAYDAAGRLVAVRSDGQEWTLRYDAFDQLAGVQAPQPGGAPTSTSEHGQVYPLDDELDGPVLELHAAQGGTALAVKVGEGARCVPLWMRGSPLLSHGGPVSAALRAASLVTGSQALQARLRSVFAPRLPQRWAQHATGGLRFDYTEIPRLEEIGCAPHHAVDQFFLRRSFYEMSAPSGVPGQTPSRAWTRERSPDPWVEGGHTTAELRPCIWTCRAAGPHLHHAALGAPPGPMSAIDALELAWHESA